MRAPRGIALALGVLAVVGLATVAVPARADAVFQVPAVYPSLSAAIVAADASADPTVIIEVTASFAEPGPSIAAVTRSMTIRGNGHAVDLSAVADEAGLVLQPPPGADIRVEDLQLVDSPGHGVTVGALSGGSVDLDGVEIQGSGRSAIDAADVADGALLRFAGTIEDVATGSGIVAATVRAGARLVVEDARIEDLASTGGADAAIRVVDLDDAELTVRRTAVLDSTRMGLSVDAGGGSALTVEDARFDDVRHVAIRTTLVDDAALELRRTTIARSGKGYVAGIVLDDTAAFLAEDLWVTGSLESGIAVNALAGATGATATIRRATIEDSAKAGLTAILNGTAALTIENTTVTGNHGDTNGSEVVSGLVAAIGPTASVDVDLSTLVDNLGGPDVFAAGAGRLRLDHTIVGRTSAYKVVPTTPSLVVSDAMGPLPVVEIERTLVGTWNADADAAVRTGAGNRFDAATPIDPGLAAETVDVGYGVAALLDLGRPWTIFRPLPGSPVVDAGDPLRAGLPAGDQRGVGRVLDAAVDLGAVEARPVPAAPAAADVDAPRVAPPTAVAPPATSAVPRPPAVEPPASGPVLSAVRRPSHSTSLDVARPARLSGLAIAAAALLVLGLIACAAHVAARASSSAAR